MEFLHDNKEQFQDAIELAYEQTGIMAQAIENVMSNALKDIADSEIFK